MTRLIACLALLALLAACAEAPSYSPPYSRAADYDPGPYMMVPTGGLAATAYWGAGYYDPWVGAW